MKKFSRGGIKLPTVYFNSIIRFNNASELKGCCGLGIKSYLKPSHPLFDAVYGEGVAIIRKAFKFRAYTVYCGCGFVFLAN